MRNFYFTLGMIMLLVLASCAGTPAEDTSAPELTVETVSADPVLIWKPDSVVFRYVDGTVDKTVMYTYDDEGRLLKSEDFDSRGTLLFKRQITYKQGDLISEELSDRFGPISLTQYELGDNGHVIEQIKQDSRGEVLSIISLSYNDGLLVKTTARDAFGNTHMVSEYSYQDGLVILVQYILPDGTEDARFERILDNGRVSMERTTLPDGTVEIARLFEYMGNLIYSETHYAGTDKIKSATFNYDENENVIREIWSDRAGNDYEVIERTWKRFEIVE